jgi:hypothetical protein
MRFCDGITAAGEKVICTIDHSPYWIIGDRDFIMQRTQCNENSDFTICEIAIESRPSDPEMIRTIDLTSHQSFGDRDLKVTRTCNIRNAEIAVRDIAI